MDTAIIQRRKRRRGRDMTLTELRKLEFLNGAQAAKYCGLAPRTFYDYISAGLITPWKRVTATNKEKNLYCREELDKVLKPRQLMEKMKYIQEQTKTSLTAKRERS